MDKLLYIGKGLLIGIATLVPGVSGGTMAIILGLYDKIIHALGTFFRSWKKNSLFLLQVGLGALGGAFLFSRLISLAIDHYRFPVQFLFMGFIIGGLPVLYQKTKSSISKKRDLLYLLAGLVVVLLMTVKPGVLINLAGGKGAASFFFLLAAGFTISVALILPGISTSFLLLTLGLYEITLRAVHTLDLTFLLPMVLGCIVGIMTTTRILERILHKYPRKAYLVIIGFILGSVIQVFPGFPRGMDFFTSLIAVILGFLAVRQLSRY